ncbi:MAG: ThuA domain-containing protein [Balneolaceae bacterium]
MMKKIWLFLFAAAMLTPKTLPAQDAQFNTLLFTKTEGWHHESINEGVDAIRELGERHAFNVNWQEMTGVFTDEGLANYDVIIFLNTTGDVLNDEQQAAVERFIQSGKGFVGIHSASDTEYDWQWYTQLVGRMFKTHPKIETAEITVHNNSFPGLERYPETRWWTDEWYEFQDETVDGLNYLITVDEDTYDVTDDWGKGVSHGMGDFHPVAWYHEFDGGRSFYTAMGHMPENFSDELFLEHIFGGILWAATGKGL